MEACMAAVLVGIPTLGLPFRWCLVPGLWVVPFGGHLC